MPTILLIDDNKRIRRMITRRLKKIDLDVHEAENGKAGVEKAFELKPDLILMDMHMPVMDGYQATQTLRAQGYQGLIVALSASAMAEEVHKAIKAGCDHHFAKPIELDFEERIKSLLEADSRAETQG